MNTELLCIIATTAAVICIIIWDATAVPPKSKQDEDPLAECSCSAM